MKKLAILIPMLIFAGCASTQPTMQTRYVLNSAGDLQEQQYYTPNNDDKYWKTGAIIGASIIGIAGLAWLIDEWREPNEVTVEAAPQSSQLFPTGGTTQSSWSTDFVQPVYQPL